MMGQKGQLGWVDIAAHEVNVVLTGSFEGDHVCERSCSQFVARQGQQVGWGRRRFYVSRWNLNIFAIIVSAAEGEMS